MKTKHIATAVAAGAIVSSLGLVSCGSEEESASTEAAGYSAGQVAEALYTVLKSDRTIYAKKVVNRLVNEDKVIKAHEEWQENQALLLPAQFFREGAEMVDAAEKPFGFSYSLQSKWPLNMENAKKKTPAVIEGLEAVSDPDNEAYGKKWTGEEEIAGQKYFVGIYPDKAVAPACWTCHNEHDNRQPDYPEFKKGDVMGGIVIRIPMD
ncbi:MAG: Tll0287-like domain-containing protein [Akkermansiaceae bacterium]